MKLKFKRLAEMMAVCWIALCAGCAKMPFQKATWSGLAESVTLYDDGGKPHAGLKFHLESGPRMGDKSMNWGGVHTSSEPTNEFFREEAILVNKKFFLVQGLEGHKLRVTGLLGSPMPLMRHDWLRDRYVRGPLDPSDNHEVLFRHPPGPKPAGMDGFPCLVATHIKDLGPAK